jgi:microcystin-dependent protein
VVGKGAGDVNLPIATFGASGNVLFQNAIDSATAFQLQNLAGKTVLTADTSGGQVVLGNSGASGITGLAKFNYSGQTGSISLTPANPSSTAYTITLPAETGVLCSTANVCSGYAPSTGGSGYVQLQATTPGSAQTGNLNITGTAIAGTFSGSGSALTSLNGTNISSGTVADARLSANVALLNGTGPQTFTGNNKFTGTVLAQNTSDSSTAFQVQNQSGNNYLLVNTSGASVSLGNTGIASTIQIGNTTGAVAQTVNIGNNATASSATTVVLGSTIGTSPLTLQAGSTGATLKTTSTTAFVIQKADGTGTILSADTSGAKITLGAAGSTPVILVLGVKNDNATDPTCTAGAIYYNSTAAAFRGCQDIPSGFTNLGNPAGTILQYAGSSAPSGYLIADGSSLLRATYATLFAIIGTTYGSADGTHFNIPDLRGRTAVGLNSSEVTRTDVNALGNNEGAVIGSRTPYHKSTVVQPTISVTGNPTITVVQPTISVTGNPTISVTGNPTITINDSGHAHGTNAITNPGIGASVSNGAGFGPAFATATINSATTGITATASGGSYSASGGSYSASGGSATASGGSYSASGGTVGPQTNVPTDTGAYLTVNYIIKY